MENPHIQPILIENIRIIKERMTNDKGDISDVHDGRIFKKVTQDKSLQDKFLLTFNFSTHGAAWFHSSPKSGWPLLCNELPAEIRLKNLILAGSWISESEPTPKLMNLYMSTFIAQAENLYKR